jgi:hypothetical protein
MNEDKQVNRSWGHKITIYNTTLLMYLVIAGLAFLPVEYFVPRLDLFEICNAICFSAALGFCIGYVVPFWDAIKLPPHRMNSAHLLVTGAWLVCFAAMQVFALQFTWRITGRPEWFINSPFVAFTRWELATGLAVMMTTSFSKHGDIEASGYARSAAWIAVFVFAVAVVVSLYT